MSFQDLFSAHAVTYQKYRPSYPPELFSFLSSLTPGHELARDCGTGNGQAAVMLADHFDTVYATDPGEQQIANAVPHEKVMYKAEPAETSSLGDQSVDIVTAAQALHWFDFEKFYAEVNRVLKPGGIMAAWAYGVPRVSADIDALVDDLHDHILNDYWQEENRMIDKGYTTIPFPFAEICAPDFYIKKEMEREELLGHLSSWSATQKYIKAKGIDPVNDLRSRMESVWTDGSREVIWKLILKVGRKI